MPMLRITDAWVNEDDWLVMVEGTQYWVKVRDDCKKKVLPRSYKSYNDERVEHELKRQRAVNSKFLNVRLDDDDVNHRELLELERMGMTKLKAKGELINLTGRTNSQVAREIRQALMNFDYVEKVYSTIKKEEDKDTFELKIVVEKHGKFGELDEICLNIWESLEKLEFVDGERLENVEPEKVK